MGDKVLFRSDRTDLDGRHLEVVAERGYGDVVTVKVANEDGEVAIFLHDGDEAVWLGEALIAAGKSISQSTNAEIAPNILKWPNVD